MNNKVLLSHMLNLQSIVTNDGGGKEEKKEREGEREGAGEGGERELEGKRGD